MQKVESVEEKPMRWILQEVESLKRVLEGESIAGNSLAAHILEYLKRLMEGESIEGPSLAADMLECKSRSATPHAEGLIQRMERLRIEGSSLAADMPELNKSTKAAQEAHSENKNEEVAKPELDSDIDYGSMEIIDIASIDPAYLEDMPCYDNLLLDVDED
ncbi:hypothetical protein OROGR_024328 [Orobanche gracilis]